MRVLIIEDEKMAASRLEKLIISVSPKAEIVAKIESVKRSVEWFNSNPSPDLVFMDIQLSDGLSFEIFDFVEVNCPIIFTTAYDEYALKAFKVNSIDYLLKPIDEEDLTKALEKFNRINKTETNQIEQITQVIETLSNKYKNRFLIKIGEHIKSIPADDIHYFFSRNKATYSTIEDGKNYLLDYSLDQLEDMLDPKSFFRVSRQFIVSIKGIKDIISYSNSRLKIVFKHDSELEGIVSRDRVSEFKNWLDS